jgi:topoisomerase IA-like protein
MATLKEFEDALREQGMNMALAILEKLRERDRATRTIRPARRVVGRKMTPELAREILDMHAATDMTQQEIAFRLGVNQGRVNEVIKRGKWLDDDPTAPEQVARDQAKDRLERGVGIPARPKKAKASGAKRASAKREGRAAAPAAKAKNQAQFAF